MTTESEDWSMPEEMRPQRSEVRFDLDRALQAMVSLRAEVPVTLHQAVSVLRRAGFQATPPWHAIPSAWGPTQFLVLSNPAL